jgi:serine/threonine protein kinase
MAYMHDRGYIHRDIKGGNILLNKQGILKIADFGLARVLLPQSVGSQAHYTSKVVTLWYRAPELLLGMTNYGPAIDLWSIGCFFTELLTGKPLLPGRDEAQ